MQPIDPSSYYNDPGLQQAQQQSQQAAQGYSQAVTNAATLPDMLKSALDKKFSENNPLIQQRETATKNYLNEITNAPISVLPENNEGMVFSPLAQANMIQGRRSAAIAPITSLNDIIGWQQGGIHNTVDSAAKMYQTLAAAKAAEAEQARQKYTDLLALIAAKVDQSNKNREFTEGVRQFNVKQKNESGSDISELLQLITMLQSGQDTQNEDNFWEDDGEVMGPPSPSKPKADLRSLNLGLNSGVGMGNIPLPTTPAQPKKKKESLPTFQTWDQLFK